jgi:hypothetical protein
MRNVWKGMMLGALAGAGIGLAVDALEALGREGRALGNQGLAGARDLAVEGSAAVKDAHLPERAAELAGQGRDALADAHLPERARDAAVQGRDALVSADLPARAREASSQALAKASEVADRSGVGDALGARADQLTERLEP